MHEVTFTKDEILTLRRALECVGDTSGAQLNPCLRISQGRDTAHNR
jgi:hypothetical protein